jgi:hypothetical protein
MGVALYPIRDMHAVWRDITGEVVIAAHNSQTICVLNKTASLIWTLADGTRQVKDIVAEVCSGFEVTPEQARVDVEEFCRQLLEAGLISMNNGSKDALEA